MSTPSVPSGLTAEEQEVYKALLRVVRARRSNGAGATCPNRIWRGKRL